MLTSFLNAVFNHWCNPMYCWACFVNLHSTSCWRHSLDWRSDALPTMELPPPLPSPVATMKAVIEFILLCTAWICLRGHWCSYSWLYADSSESYLCNQISNEHVDMPSAASFSHLEQLDGHLCSFIAISYSRGSWELSYSSLPSLTSVGASADIH
jgi:hypothetical protein